jgi:hypothetical protein
MRFSASRLKLEQECPAKARFRYDEKLPTRQNAKASWGTIIHDALKYYNDTNGDLTGAKERFLDHWLNPEKLGVAPDHWPKGTNWAGLKNKGIEVLERYDLDHRLQKRTVLGTEVEFHVPFGKHSLYGFVDLLELEKSGTGRTLLKVVDFKGNVREPNRTELALDIQFTVYAYAVSRPEFWLGTDDTPGIDNGEWYWQTVVPTTPPRCIWYQLWNAKQIDAGPRTDLDFRRLYRLADQIERSLDAGLAIPRIGEACVFCDFTEQCWTEIPVSVGALNNPDDPNRWI